MSTDGSTPSLEDITQSVLDDLNNGRASFEAMVAEQNAKFNETRNALLDKFSKTGEPPKPDNAEGVDELVAKLNQYPMIIPAVTASADKIIADIAAAVQTVLQSAQQ